MPTYEYLCTSCQNQWEEIQKISADATEICPKCGKPTAKRQISAGNFILKGGGWYADAYSSKPKSSGSADSKSEGGGSAATSSSEGKSESKSSEGASSASTSSSEKKSESAAPKADAPKPAAKPSGSSST